MFQRIVNNFYLRNIVACFLYISPDLFQDLAIIHQIGIKGLFNDIAGFFCFFIYFIFHNRVLYEELFKKKKYLLYIICFALTMFAWRESTSYLIWLFTKPEGETTYYIAELKKYNWLFWMFIYWADFIYCWIATGVYIAFEYFKKRTMLLEMENEKKELELKQLNEQLNPHFLFNALNNIYSYLLNEKNNEKELILKLSELMRYVLDSSKKDKVELTDELRFIEHYLAFEKERLGSRCEIHYMKNIQATRFRIVPLILFTFIENAFKHGTVSMTKSVIDISVNANDESLVLKVINPIYNTDRKSTNTGLDNTKRRLTLLYGDKYFLDISTSDNNYIVVLELKDIQ